MRFAARSLRAFFAVGLLLSLPSLHAQTAREALEPLAPLVGKVWIATFPDGKLTDEQEFSWMFDGKFVRNPHRVRNEKGEVVYQGETIYGWDPGLKTIIWTYWNSTGGTITGTLTRSGDLWLAAGENSALPPQPKQVRSTLKFVGPEEWTSTSMFPEGAGWKERFTITFRPKP